MQCNFTKSSTVGTLNKLHFNVQPTHELNHINSKASVSEMFEVEVVILYPKRDIVNVVLKQADHSARCDTSNRTTYISI
jgi:hypothetical protein